MSTTDPQRNAVLIDRNLLGAVSAEACASPRLRKHRNFHSSDTALSHRLAPSATCGITIPHGVFHSVLAFESGTVMFESKAGPYRPLSETEKAPWAPGEGEPGWEAFLQSLQSVFRR